MCVIVAVAEDETLEVQKTELGSAQRRMGLDAVGADGVAGDPLRTVKRDQPARMTAWSGHYQTHRGSPGS